MTSKYYLARQPEEASGRPPYIGLLCLIGVLLLVAVLMFYSAAPERDRATPTSVAGESAASPEERRREMARLCSRSLGAASQGQTACSTWGDEAEMLVVYNADASELFAATIARNEGFTDQLRRADFTSLMVTNMKGWSAIYADTGAEWVRSRINR